MQNFGSQKDWLIDWSIDEKINTFIKQGLH